MGATAAAYPLLFSAGASAVASLAVGALMDKPSATSAVAAPPAVTPPTPMPDADKIKSDAARASIAEQARRRGRASTILTDPGVAAADPLGGA